jgi:hypothetical protein
MEQDDLTVGSLLQLIATIPKPSQWRFVVVKPELAKQVRAEASRPIKPGDLSSEVQTMEIFEKPGQVMGAWVFSDRGLLNGYLAGFFTELDLARYAVHGRCRSEHPLWPKT